MTPRKTAATPDTIQPDASAPYSDTASMAIAEPVPFLDHFARLSQLNVNDRVEKKKSGGVELSYLSWAFAWKELKTKYPDAVYNIQRFGPNNLPYVYDENTGYMVFTDMTVQGITHSMWLPVMDGANKAMKDKPYQYTTGFGQYKKEKSCDAADMFDVNKTLMRCLVKNIGMFGLGLYLYSGEDLPTELTENDLEDKIIDAKKAVSDKQASPDNTEELKIKKDISERMVKLTAGKSDEEKMSIAKGIIEPIIGMLNYNLCSDIDKLNQLLSKLKQ